MDSQTFVLMFMILSWAGPIGLGVFLGGLGVLYGGMSRDRESKLAVRQSKDGTRTDAR